MSGDPTWGPWPLTWPGPVWLVVGPAAGGMRAYVETLARGLARAHVPTVLWTADRETSWAALAPEVEVRSLYQEGAEPAGFAVLQRLPLWRHAVDVFRTACRAERPAVVHVHGLRAAALTQVAFHRVPRVVTLHTWPRGWTWRPLLRWIAGRTDALVAVSQPLARWMQEARLAARGALDLRFFWVIPPPLLRHGAAPATPRHARRALGLPEFGPVVGTVARLSKEKGVDLLLRAVALLRRWGYPVSCLVIGDGPQRHHLRRLANRLGIAPCVRWAGHLEAPGCLLRAVDIYVQPSRRETFGMAVAEAMAAGRPVVATRTGGLADLITDGLTGRLVPAGDFQVLARVLAELIQDQEQRRRLARAAVARASRWPGPEALTRRHLELYAQVLSATSTLPGRSRGRRGSHGW